MYIHRLTHVYPRDGRFRTGKISRNRLFCESCTIGIACVCDAVPA